MPNIYYVRDERGQERVIDAPHMERHFRTLLLPILSEVGLPPDAIASYDIGHLVNIIVGAIRDGRGGLAVARQEFRKLKDQREADYQTVLNFIRSRQASDGSEAPEVIDLDSRRRAA